MAQEKLDLEQRIDLLEARIGTITKALSQMLMELGDIDQVELAQDTRPWDPDKIVWKEAISKSSGKPYERANDKTNPDFQLLTKDLKAHGRKFQKQGYYYWLFDRSDDIGRKKV